MGRKLRSWDNPLRGGREQRRLVTLGAGVDEPATGEDPGVGVQLVRVGTARAQDMQYWEAPGNQGVRDQPAVAAPGDGLGAEDGDGFLAGTADQPVEGGRELRGLHVVGVAAERLDA